MVKRSYPRSSHYNLLNKSAHNQPTFRKFSPSTTSPSSHAGAAEGASGKMIRRRTRACIAASTPQGPPLNCSRPNPRPGVRANVSPCCDHSAGKRPRSRPNRSRRSVRSSVAGSCSGTEPAGGEAGLNTGLPPRAPGAPSSTGCDGARRTAAETWSSWRSASASASNSSGASSRTSVASPPAGPDAVSCSRPGGLHGAR